jgi:cytochrome c oxidase subunit 3
VAEAVIVARQFDDAEQQRRASDLGMWVFLATEILFFGGLFTSSLTMALAVRATKLGLRRASIGFLCATAALGIAFLGIKFTEYVRDWHERLVPVLNFAHVGPHAGGVETFFYLYFFTTGLHAIHLIIGIATVAVVATMAARRRFSPDYFTPVELTGLYWHLVDVVWIFLYPLLYLVART